MNVLFWKRFITAWFIAFLSLTLSRLVFYLNLLSYFESGFSDVFHAFLFGLQFDAVSIAYLLGPFFVGVLFVKTEFQALIAKTYFIGMLAAMNLLNCIDAEFFKFTSRRSTDDLFEYAFLSDDIFNIGPNLLGYFWYLLAAFFVITALTWFFYDKIFKNRIDFAPSSRVLTMIFTIAILTIAARGGFQPIPLSIIDASDIHNSRLGPVVLSTPFTMIKTIGKPELMEFDYSENEMVEISPIIYPSKNGKTGVCKGQNVVVIILESFGNEYIGALNGLETSYTPFLDSLIGKSLVFENALANGHRSIEGIPAVVASIPTLMYEPYTTSRYAGNRLTSLANVLGSEGYYSAFMHGGNKNSMNFESFAKQAEFDMIYDRDDYPFPDRDYDGYWGIFDHFFLRQCVQEFSEFKQPFFASIFTLSSHYPYSLPNEYKNTFPKGSLPIHENIGYADEALRQFFEAASQTDWYDSTLFVLTADHTSLSEHPQFQTKVGSLRIPIILFHPNDSSMIGRQSQIVQQTDIQPTILDLLGFDRPFFSFGVSAFDSTAAHFAVAFKNDQYQLLLNGKLIGFDGEHVRFKYFLKGNQLYKDETNKDSPSNWDNNEQFMKAYLQNYSTALLKNKMTFEAWEKE